MNILAITSEAWYLSLVSIVIVFVILILLVWILDIFSALARKTVRTTRTIKDTHTQYQQAKTFANASEEDKAAVAMALYLYAEEKKNRESRVLTITHIGRAWSSELNPRL